MQLDLQVRVKYYCFTHTGQQNYLNFLECWLFLSDCQAGSVDCGQSCRGFAHDHDDTSHQSLAGFCFGHSTDSNDYGASLYLKRYLKEPPI